jgi:hypothetical protein
MFFAVTAVQRKRWSLLPLKTCHYAPPLNVEYGNYLCTIPVKYLSNPNFNVVNLERWRYIFS